MTPAEAAAGRVRNLVADDTSGCERWRDLLDLDDLAVLVDAVDGQGVALEHPSAVVPPGGFPEPLAGRYRIIQEVRWADGREPTTSDEVRDLTRAEVVELLGNREASVIRLGDSPADQRSGAPDA